MNGTHDVQHDHLIAQGGTGNEHDATPIFYNNALGRQMVEQSLVRKLLHWKSLEELLEVVSASPFPTRPGGCCPNVKYKGNLGEIIQSLQ